MVQERPWLPPWPLAAGQLAHGLSWGLLIALGLQGSLGFSMPGLAWIHLVALGWLTLSSLCVLFHVLPGFLDVEIPYEGVARAALAPLGLGIAGMVAGFWLSRADILGIASLVVICSLAAVLVPMGLTIRKARPEGEASLGRGFAMVLAFLALAALIGLAMAGALAGWWPGGILEVGPPTHAHLAAGGWLTVLIFGVSMRTIRRIAGSARPSLGLHRALSASMVLGLVALASGMALRLAFVGWIGALLCLCAVLIFILETALMLATGRATHKPPLAFLFSSLAYLGGAAALGLGVMAGRSDWMAAYAFLALVGWIGQTVNGHLLHIGVRFIATQVIGPEDETEPENLLNPLVSWVAWGLFQVAICLGTVALLVASGPFVAGAGALGFAGWACLMANARIAWAKARKMRDLAPARTPMVLAVELPMISVKKG